MQILRRAKHEKNNKSWVSNSAFKKGNASVETVIVVAVLFVFSISAIFVYDFFDDIVQDVVDDPDISSTATEKTEALRDQYPNIFDTAFVIILVVLWIATIVSAFQIDTYPVFFGISVLALLVSLAVPPVLGNAFTDTMDDDSTTGLTDEFPMMNYVMTHILQFAIVIGGSVLVALFAKAKTLS